MPSQRERTQHVTAKRPATAKTRPDDRRPLLQAALDLTRDQPLATAVRIANDGGILEFGLQNTGLSPAFQAYVEISRVVDRLRTPSGRSLLVFQRRDNAPSFWRRPLRGEILPPDSVLTSILTGSPGSSQSFGNDTFTTERFISDDEQETRSSLLARSWAGVVAPRERVAVSLEVPGPFGETESEGVWAWCLVARCFDILQEPPAPLTHPTPDQPAHHTTLSCLHDTID